MMMKKFVIVIVISIVTIAGAFFWLGHSQKSTMNKAQAVTEQLRRIAAEGKVGIAPGFNVELSSGLGGRIVNFPVKEGDSVNKGEIIAMLSSRLIRARLRMAEAELASAKARLSELISGPRSEKVKIAAAALSDAVANLKLVKLNLARYRTLYKENSISKEFLEENERNAAVAEAKVKEARERELILEKGSRLDTIKAQENVVKMDLASVEYYNILLNKCTITAPISGTLIHKYMEAGEYITNKMVIGEIADIKEIRVNADVDESNIDLVRIGDRAEITSDAFPGKMFTGHVSWIASCIGKRQVNPSPAQIFGEKVARVRIRPDDKTKFPLKLGMVVDVKIAPGGRP